MPIYLFSISHWGMIEIDCEAMESYWNFIWYSNVDAQMFDNN